MDSTESLEPSQHETTNGDDNSSIAWQESTTNIEERAKMLQDCKPFADVRFRVEVRRPDDNSVGVQHFDAHRLLLASASPVFAQHLYEKNSAATGFTEYRVTDIAHKAFETMLQYVYRGNIEFDTPYLALQTYKAAKKYNIRHLKDLCVEHFQGRYLPALDVIRILEDELHHEINGLHQQCIDAAEDRSLEIIRLAAEKAKPQTVNMILQMERLCVTSEYCLLRELVDGVRVRGVRGPLSSPEVRGRFLRQFLKNIRFLAMTPQEFSMALEICDSAILPDEGYAILRMLSNPGSRALTLPQWCNNITRPRISQARHVTEMELLPPYPVYSDIPPRHPPDSLISAVYIKVHGGRFVFTAVALSYRRIADDLEADPEDSENVPCCECTLNIRNRAAGIAYERRTSLRLDHRITVLQFPAPLPVSSGQEAEVVVRLDGIVGVDFSDFQQRSHVAGNEREGFEVILNNFRSMDNTFSVSKLYYT